MGSLGGSSTRTVQVELMGEKPIIYPGTKAHVDMENQRAPKWPDRAGWELSVVWFWRQ